MYPKYHLSEPQYLNVAGTVLSPGQIQRRKTLILKLQGAPSPGIDRDLKL